MSTKVTVAAAAALLTIVMTASPLQAAGWYYGHAAQPGLYGYGGYPMPSPWYGYGHAYGYGGYGRAYGLGGPWALRAMGYLPGPPSRPGLYGGGF